MSNKHAFGNSKNMFNKGENSVNVFYFAKVESNQDDYDGGTIRARIKGIDDHIAAIDLPTAFPMVSKVFQVVPKAGETVLIFVPNASNPFMDRIYTGPLISQPQFLEKDLHLYTSRSMMDSGITEPKEAPSRIPENKGVEPFKEDVSLQGRKNTDITLKPNEIWIRAGKFVTTDTKDETKIFNKENPAYIQLKHDVVLKKPTTGTMQNGKPELGSVTNIVASKINLLTHKDGQPRFTLNNQDSLISEEQMLEILSKAHPLVFGDLLVEYLKLQRNAFINHVHPYHGKKPQDLSGSEDIDKYLEFDLNRLLSKNIRIN